MNPRQISNLISWWDFQNYTSRGNSSVLSVADKQGNNDLYSISEGLAPTINTGDINSYNSLLINGKNLFNPIAKKMKNRLEFSCVYVIKKNSTTDNVINLSLNYQKWGGTGGIRHKNSGWSIFWDNTLNRYGFSISGGFVAGVDTTIFSTSNQSVFGTPSTTLPTSTFDDWCIISFSIYQNTDNSSYRSEMYINGILYLTKTIVSGFLYPDFKGCKTNFNIGNRNESSLYTNGSFSYAEILCYNKDLSNGERKYLERYLSNKYNIGLLS